MKKIFLLVIVFILVISTKFEIYATSNEILENQFDLIDIDSFNNQLNSFDDSEYTKDFDLKKFITQIIKGELSLDFGAIVSNIFKTILKEIYSQINIMRNIIFIACVCALAKNLSSSFQSKSVGELSFYSCYIVIVIMLIQSFRVAVELASETINTISTLLDVFLPVLTTLLVASGNYMSVTMFHPILILTSEVMTKVIKNIMLPFIFSTAMLEIINYISEREILGNMSTLIKKCLGWLLKGISIIFTTALTLHKLTIPAVEGVINKTAKLAIGAIPVVGEVMTGTVDTIASWTGLIKNGTVLAIIIFMILLCAVPVLKLVALILVYRFTAAIIQPISDSRIIKCIDGIATSCQLLLGALVCVMIMFIFVAIIGISVTTI